MVAVCAGIPGFDDNDVPRVAGSVAAVLLAVNHVLSQSPVPAAQVRSEELGLLLALAAFFTPTLGKRLEEAARSGRRAAAVLPGSANTMRISEDEADATRRELAWATFAMLRNVNAAAVVIWGANGELLAARGQLPAAVAAGGVTLEEAVAQAAASEALGEAALAGPSYLPDAGAIGKAGAGGLALLPEGAQALWACPMKGRQGGGDAGRLLLVAAEPRAFSQKERAWAREQLCASSGFELGRHDIVS